MTGIVGRLRSQAFVGDLRLIADAADEIERLHERLAAAEAVCHAVERYQRVRISTMHIEIAMNKWRAACDR